jgi:2,3-bisphosphoglycerate-dependent phosphoglycerate mutase
VVAMIRLWLVRHGATEWSESGRLCGWTDVPLSPSGRSQAEPLRARFHGRRFDGVWASDLVRASEFAELVVGGATLDPRLRELDFGRLEGKTWDECDAATQQALVGIEGFAAPDGESTAQIRDRALGFVTELGMGSHLVFTHGGLIRALFGLRGISVSPPPGSVTRWAGRPCTLAAMTDSTAR